MKLLLKISILSIFCIPFLQVSAQVQLPLDGVTIELGNENPAPGQNVEVTIESFSFDLNAAAVVWTVNGKVYAQGVGIKSISLKAPPIGSKTTVVANVKAAGVTEISKSIVFGSGNVDIVWEVDGYTPPFFQGRLPYSYQNSVKLIAIPHISSGGAKEIDPKTLVYSWKLGGKYIEGGQGYGKQSVVVRSDIIPKPLEISVDVSNREQTVHTAGSINLAPSEPSVSFYEEDSLYGILFNKAIGESITMKNSEMKIIAIPYGFNLNASKDTYTWSINNIEQTDLAKNRSIVVRTKGDMDGTALINMNLRSESNILQGAAGSFVVYFKKLIQ